MTQELGEEELEEPAGDEAAPPEVSVEGEGEEFGAPVLRRERLRISGQVRVRVRVVR